MPIKYREYQNKDKQQLLKLAKELDDYIKNLDPIGRIKNLPGFAEASLKETLDNVSKFQGKVWLAEDESKVIGYIIGVIWKQSDKNKLEIGTHKLGEVTDIYLNKSYRNQGLGTTMLQKMETYFKEQGCDSIWVSVFAPNHPAYKLYKNFGFSERTIGMIKQI